MLSPWLEEMSNDLLRVVHGHALPRDVANDQANDDDGGRIAGEDASPAWLSAARRELDGEDATPAEGEDARKNNGKNNGKQNGKRK